MNNHQILVRLAAIAIIVFLLWAVVGIPAQAQDTAENKAVDRQQAAKNSSNVFETPTAKKDDGKGPNKKQLIFTVMSLAAAVGVIKFL